LVVIRWPAPGGQIHLPIDNDWRIEFRKVLNLGVFPKNPQIAGIDRVEVAGVHTHHAGWFPAFAVALITLIIGILLSFPPIALGLLVGFSVSTGPVFADMGYDLRAGYLLRGEGANPVFELAGRRQQLYAAMLAFLIAIPTVWFEGSCRRSTRSMSR
jgi:hypothetical protein